MVPEQALYDYFYKLCQSLSYATYDYLPLAGEKVHYPFVVLGDVQLTPSATKTSLNGQIDLLIDVWGTKKHRFEVSTMTETIYKLKRTEFMVEGFAFYPRQNRMSKQLTSDTSVADQTFVRGMLTLSFDLM